MSSGRVRDAYGSTERATPADPPTPRPFSQPHPLVFLDAGRGRPADTQGEGGAEVPIVVVEPSCAATLHEELPRLVSELNDGIDGADWRWPDERLAALRGEGGTQASHAQPKGHAPWDGADPRHDPRPWEPLNGGPVRVGDEVRRELKGITTTAVVGSVDDDGDPWAAEGGLIGVLEYGTWHVRRAVQELPTKPAAVIVTNDGCENIEAVVSGVVWRTREAILRSDGRWHGVWRRDPRLGALTSMPPQRIVPNTWKVDDQ